MFLRNRFIVILAMILAFGSITTANAQEMVKYAEPIKSNVIINEQQITSNNIRYDLVRFNDIVYYPISLSALEAVGYLPVWDSDSKAIVLQQTEATGFDQGNWNSDISSFEVKDASTQVQVDGEGLGSDEYPLIEIGSVTYFPLTNKNISLLGWHYKWDKEIGMVIDTDSKKDLDTYLDQLANQVGEEDEKIAQVMQSVNGRLSNEEALYYVKLINESCEKYDIDKYWFISMMWLESNFDTTCEYKGAIGLMQIMTSTGKTLGLTKDQLFDPKYSIEYSAKYLRGHYDRYGDLRKAIIAYNQGTTRVDRGTYSTKYYDWVSSRHEKLMKAIN